VQAAGEQEPADIAGGVNPPEAVEVKLIESGLNPGQPFSAVVVIATLFPEVAPLAAVMLVELEVSASHGTVFPELSKRLLV
jgi:hypothetical protein